MACRSYEKVRFGGTCRLIFRVEKIQDSQLAHYFCPEDGGDTFVRNVDLTRATLRHIPGDGILQNFITSVFIPFRTRDAWFISYSVDIQSLLRPVKDHLGLRTSGVYRIPCECGRVYIGQTGRSVDIRLKEHQRHIRLEHPDKSAVSEHSIDRGHRIQFHNSSILPSKTS
jgi:hypothetical protein